MNDLTYVAFATAPRPANLPAPFSKNSNDLGNGDPGQRALCRLLNGIVGSYVDTFDEEPLPVAVADRAYQRLLEMVASLDFDGSADRRLADINRVAALDLRH